MITSAARAAVVAGCTVLLTGGCASTQNGPSVRADVPPEQHTSWSPVGAGVPFVVAVSNVCVDGDGQALVESVELVDATGIEVIDFAVTAGPTAESGSMATLDDIGAGHDRIIKTACDDVAALNVQLVRTGDESGTLRAYKVRWSSEGRSGSFESPIGLTLCDTCAQS